MVIARRLLAQAGRRGGLLRQRNFRLFWTGESISEVGNSVTIVVIPLVAIDTLHTTPSCWAASRSPRSAGQGSAGCSPRRPAP